MSRRVIYSLLVISVIGVYASCSLFNSDNKPNVVIVLTDDQGWGDVGFNGNQIIHTPVLDSLAQVGVVFNRFYVSPVSAPSRASILTGKYHLSAGVSWVTHRKDVMPESEITLAEVLRANNYSTAYFGKWHNGQQFPHNANGQGFDKFFGFSAGYWNNYFDTELEYNGKKVQTEGYITDVLTDSVVSYIAKSDQPFLAFVAYNTPHTPYQVPNKYFNKYKRQGLDSKTAAIYGMCENIDDNLLRIQNTLKLYEKHNNTIFIFLSDNGPNYVRYNGGYKGRKGQVDEGGVRVPFIINYPEGHIKSHKVMNDFAAHIDLMPTILDLCNISVDSLNFDGQSFAAILTDTTQNLTDRKFYSHQYLNHGKNAGAVRTNKYLLTCYPQDTALYNIVTDPFQMVNIIKNVPEMADSLKAAYLAWASETNSQHKKTESIQIGNAEAPIVELPAHESKLAANVQFAGKIGWANDWVLNWTDTNDYIQWPIMVKQEGLYAVKLKYVCDKNSVGSQFTLSCQNKTLEFVIDKEFEKEILVNNDRVVRDEVVELAWGNQNIGELKLNEGNCILNLKYKKNSPSNIEIKGLEIRALKQLVP